MLGENVIVSYYTRSKRSKQDIRDIVKHSVQLFGQVQTRQYMNGLERVLQDIAENPNLGRSLSDALTIKDYCCYTYNSHVIYYRKRHDDVFIVRILHGKMLPENHL
jgi:toxin ParE1/3/4